MISGGGCRSASRAGWLVNRRSLVQIPAPGCMLKCPWARYWTPCCSSMRALCWAGDLSREYPALALRQGSATQLERDKRLRTMTWHDMKWSSYSRKQYEAKCCVVEVFCCCCWVFTYRCVFSLCCWKWTARGFLTLFWQLKRKISVIQSLAWLNRVTKFTFFPLLCLEEIFHSDKQTTLEWTSDPPKKVSWVANKTQDHLIEWIKNKSYKKKTKKKNSWRVED